MAFRPLSFIVVHYHRWCHQMVSMLGPGTLMAKSDKKYLLSLTRAPCRPPSTANEVESPYSLTHVYLLVYTLLQSSLTSLQIFYSVSLNKIVCVCHIMHYLNDLLPRSPGIKECQTSLTSLSNIEHSSSIKECGRPLHLPVLLWYSQWYQQHVIMSP